MAAADERARAEVGLETLVERAGRAVATEAIGLLGGAYGRRVVVLAGRGHNGDDGRVAAAWLRRRGAQVLVVPLAEAPAQLPACDLVVDAALGTGFRGTFDAPAAPPGAAVLAVDLPSGVAADTGEACGRPLRADLTCTLAALKPGLVLGEGRALAGRVRLHRIGIDVGTPAQHLVGDEDLAWLPARGLESHKWQRASPATSSPSSGAAGSSSPARGSAPHRRRAPSCGRSCAARACRSCSTPTRSTCSARPRRRPSSSPRPGTPPAPCSPPTTGSTRASRARRPGRTASPRRAASPGAPAPSCS